MGYRLQYSLRSVIVLTVLVAMFLSAARTLGYLEVLWLAVFALVYTGPIAWAVNDARERGHSGAIILAFFALCGPLSALVWLVCRPRRKMLDRPSEDYSNSEDALAAASRLDQLGEWDAAIAMYERVVEQWPDQREYIASCIRRIEEKRALA
jgi:hypothetical protein